jgi:PAS domain S-box-containing protein
MTPPTVRTDAAAPAGLAALAALADAVDEMVWIWDAADGRLLYANAALARFVGGAPGAGANGRELLLDRSDPADAARLQQLRRQLPAAGYLEEYRVQLPAVGEQKARTARLRERAFATPAADGGLHVTHVARDVSWQFDTTAKLRAEITRRTDAERSLDEATARLQSMIAGANDPVITIDQASRVIDWNAAAERVFGWSRAEAVGQDLGTLIVPPGHRRSHALGIERFLRDGTAPIFNRRVETQAVRRSGEVFDAELSVWPVRTADGYTFSAFVRDISRRKAAAKALAESEAKYRTVVENANEGILVTAGGRILYSNPKGVELTGVDMQTALSRPFIEFIHPDDRELVMNNHVRRLRGELVDNYYQFRVLHRDGRVVWLEISAVLLEWEGKPATLNFLTDATQRKLAEEEMRRSLQRERELSELKSRFVAVASHEFRTPLAAILSSVELLDDYGPRLPEDERKEIVGLIKSSVARMNGMIEQVLLTSKLESGRFSFEPGARPLPAVLVQVAAELDQANPQAARVAMRCEGLEAPRLIDPKLVRHILLNLLGNALKYSPPDSAVICTATAEGDDIHLAVQDRGIGIPPEDVPRLFETFHRGGNVGNIQGTGIGLYIVRECVGLHLGRIDVQSTPGEGSTFHVWLHAPLVAATAPHD